VHICITSPASCNGVRRMRLPCLFFLLPGILHVVLLLKDTDCLSIIKVSSSSPVCLHDIRDSIVLIILRGYVRSRRAIPKEPDLAILEVDGISEML